MRARSRTIVRVAGGCAAYLAGSWLAGVMTLPPNALASFRPPNALLIGAALLAPPSTWWLYPFLTIPGNPALFTSRVGWLPALGYIATNIIEVGLGLAVLWLALRRAPRFNRVADCAIFVVGVAGIAAAVSASLGGVIVYVRSPAGGFWTTFRTWLLGDALSFIVIVPAIVLSARRGWWLRITRRWEAAIVLAGLMAVTVPALTGTLGDIGQFPALAYAPLPLLVWTAVRLGVVENAIAICAVSGVVLAAAITRSGAFAGLSQSDAALSMQLLLLMMALPLLFLAAMVDERRQGEARSMSVFRATPDMITITTMRDGRLIDVNESFERTSGFTRGHALGRTAMELGFWGTDPGRREAFLGELRRDGRVRDFPITAAGQNGSISHARLSSEKIELDGEDALITVRRDVTDQIRADEEKARVEEQLQQARKMEAIGQLAGGIAHDFNNLLQAIRGYAELAASRLPPNHPSQVPLQQVTRASDQAATLTGQLLTFSRREALKPQPLDLNALVGELIPILRRLIGEHIELRVEAAPVLPPMLADPSQVEQVVMNLCLNARDAMPSGGRLTIQSAAASFTGEDCRARPWARAGDWVSLCVADEGSGIPADVLPRIFEPFFTTKSVDRGTGLGLATVYAIVERHHGLLSVDTGAGTGTSFTIYFPVADEPARLADRDAALPPATAELGRGETILLAEDEPFVRELAVEFLEGAGYRVLVACDGAEAETIVHDRAHVDLALLDVAMPFRTGRQVFDTIQDVRPSLPVVFTSGYSFGELTDIKPIAGSILPKPYTRALLLTTIRAALDARQNPT